MALRPQKTRTQLQLHKHKCPCFHFLFANLRVNAYVLQVTDGRHSFQKCTTRNAHCFFTWFRSFHISLHCGATTTIWHIKWENTYDENVKLFSLASVASCNIRPPTSAHNAVNPSFLDRNLVIPYRRRDTISVRHTAVAAWCNLDYMAQKS